MSPVTIPNTFVGGTGHKARAAEVNANFQAVAAKFTEGLGGISDADVSSTAGIRASKLSSAPGSRITYAQIEDATIKPVKLEAGAALANLVAGSIAKDKLKLTSAVVSVGMAAGVQSQSVDLGVLSTASFALAMLLEGTAPNFGNNAQTPVLTLALDTSSGHYYVRAVNPGYPTVATATVNVRVHFISLT